VTSADLRDERVTDHSSEVDKTVDQGLSVVGAGRLPAGPVQPKGTARGVGKRGAPVDQAGVGTARSEVPTANSMPTKVAPSGTGAVPVLVSGPVMPAYAAPSHSQNTRPQHTAATEVISVTCSLVQVHTVSTHDESDARVWNHSATGEG
jgi:hypothetical protein